MATLNKSISIIYEQTPEVGFGHYSRSRKLATYIGSQGVDVELINIADINVDKNLPTEIAVFDISSKVNSKANALCEKAILSVGLDWLQPSQIDYNILVYPHNGAQARKEIFVGFEYVIIEDKIRKLAPINYKSRVKNALVLIGGGDLKGDSFKAGDYLHREGFNVHVVLGPLARESSENKLYKVSKNISCIAEAIADAELMVTNGGNCLFEALASGRPAIALAQTEAEHRIITEVARSKAILGTTLGVIKTDLDVSRVITNGVSMVDGAGAERIFSIIKTINR